MHGLVRVSPICMLYIYTAMQQVIYQIDRLHLKYLACIFLSNSLIDIHLFVQCALHLWKVGNKYLFLRI